MFILHGVTDFHFNGLFFLLYLSFLSHNKLTFRKTFDKNFLLLNLTLFFVEFFFFFFDLFTYLWSVINISNTRTHTL